MHCLALTHLLLSLAGSLTHRIISYLSVKAEQRHSEHLLRRQQESVQLPSHTMNTLRVLVLPGSLLFLCLMLQVGPLEVVCFLLPSIS